MVIFPSGVVIMEAVINFWAGSIMISLLSVSPQLAPGGQKRASGGVLVFPRTYRIS
jgi:hypothetical protein